MQIEMERRTRSRVDLNLQCRVSTLAQPKQTMLHETRNVSRTGMLLRWSEASPEANCPKIGEPIAIEVSLPVNPLFGQRCMLFRATVVRVSPGSEDGPLVAVSIQRSRFQAQPVGSTIFEAIDPAYVN